MMPRGFSLLPAISNATLVELRAIVSNTMAQTRHENRIERRPSGERGGRRVLRFGWDYDDPAKWLGNAPAWLNLLAAILSDECGTNLRLHESVTLNDYGEGGSIDPHIDSPAFGEPVASLSLGEGGLLNFVSPHGDPGKIIELWSGSLFLLEGEARTSWMHSIFCKVPRYSVVFRKRNEP